MKDAPPPRARRDLVALVGHQAAAATIEAAFARGRPHHAWLLTGPRGVGKAAFAVRAAAWVLSGAPASPGILGLDPASPVARRVAAHTHGDAKILERAWDDERKRMRAEIVVDQVRDLGRFFAHAAGEGAYRVVVVDPADELNRNAANALLKLLEEPPAGVMLFLVSQAPGALLPTIRSRCRTLRLAPPPAAAAEAWLAAQRPGSDAGLRGRALLLAGGAPGAALARLDALARGFDAQDAVWQVLRALPRGDRAGGQALAQRLGRSGGQDDFADFFAALDATLARLCGAIARGEAAGLPEEERALATALPRLRPLADWALAHARAREAAALADEYNLDRRAIAWLTIQGLRPDQRPYTPAAPPPWPRA